MAYNWKIYQGSNLISETTGDQLSYNFPKNESQVDIVYTVKVNEGEVCSASTEVTVEACEQAEISAVGQSECCRKIVISSDGYQYGVETEEYTITGISKIGDEYVEPTITVPPAQTAQGYWTYSQITHDSSGPIGNFSVKVKFSGREMSGDPRFDYMKTIVFSLNNVSASVVVNVCSDITFRIRWTFIDANGIPECKWGCPGVPSLDRSSIGVCARVVTEEGVVIRVKNDIKLRLKFIDTTNSRNSFDEMTTYVCDCLESARVWDTQTIDITIGQGNTYGKGFLPANIPTIACKDSQEHTRACNPSQPGITWDFDEIKGRFEYIRQIEGETYTTIAGQDSGTNCQNICTFWDDTYNQ